MKFRKLLASHVLNDEVLFRGCGIQREGEQSDTSGHVPATPTRALIRIGDVWPGGKCARKDLCYSPCPGGVLTFCLH